MGTILPEDISPPQLSDRRLCIAIFRLGAALLLPEILEIYQTDSGNSVPVSPALFEIGGQTLEKRVRHKGGALRGWYSAALGNTGFSLPASVQGFRE